MTRPIAIVVLLAGLSGCTKPCKDGSVLLTVSGVPSSTTHIDITSSVGGSGGADLSSPSPTGTFELDFGNGYPSGQMLTITATALTGSTVIASGQTTLTLGDSCETASIALTAFAGDMTTQDLTGADLTSQPDLTGLHVCVFDSDLGIDEFDSNCIFL